VSDATAFPESDPRQALRTLIERGAGNSADAIMLRLLWLREDHPEAAVTTEVIRVERELVVMRASIVLGSAAAGSGIAAARIEDGDDWAGIVERTETIAISRALDTLGYVVRAAGQSAPEPMRDARQVEEEPASLQPVPQVILPSKPEPAPQSPSPQRERATSPHVDEAAPPVVNALRRANWRPGLAEPTPASFSGEENAHLAEYSWNTFWSRARSLGLTPARVTEALGRPANQMTPKEAVAGLIEAGVWPAPADE
jgi:hypothetical protein